MYGVRKIFETTAGDVAADTRVEAIRIAEGRTKERPVTARGPREVPSLRSLGVRAVIRHMNRTGL